MRADIYLYSEHNSSTAPHHWTLEIFLRIERQLVIESMTRDERIYMEVAIELKRCVFDVIC